MFAFLDEFPLFHFSIDTNVVFNNNEMTHKTAQTKEKNVEILDYKVASHSFLRLEIKA